MPLSAAALSQIYGKMEVMEEGFVLDNEPEKVPKGLRICLLTEYLILNNRTGVPVAPKWEDCTEEFLENLEAYGIMAFPCEDHKWQLWTGHWQVWPEIPYELVHFPVITAFAKEKDERFCNGNALGLWLYGTARCAALMAPALPYVGLAKETLDSWSTADSGEVGNPKFVFTTIGEIPPHWWRKYNGAPGDARGTKQVWKAVSKQLIDYQQRQQSRSGTDGGSDPSEPKADSDVEMDTEPEPEPEPETEPEVESEDGRKGKGKAMAKSKSKAKSKGRSKGDGKSKSKGRRMGQGNRSASTRKTFSAPSRNQRVGNVNKRRVSPGEGPRATPTEDQVAGPSTDRTRIAGRKRKRQSAEPPRRGPLRIIGDPETETEPESEPPSRKKDSSGMPVDGSEVATPAEAGDPAEGEPRRDSTPLNGSGAAQTPLDTPSKECLEAKQRAQREAEPSYSPGPSTQAANVLPPLSNDLPLGPEPREGEVPECGLLADGYTAQFPFTQVPQQSAADTDGEPVVEQADKHSGSVVVDQDPSGHPQPTAPVEPSGTPCTEPSPPDVSGAGAASADPPAETPARASPESAHRDVSPEANVAGTSSHSLEELAEGNPLLTGSRSSKAHRDPQPAFFSSAS
ncbi:hypothetical protein RhiJN_02584 [Ceratobasidium sp. AG-Ba]|nr:hypothetical protein RhiJN_02584 [Ceratobasidium sp. AG-Ba]QRW09582.1 hypothetical protein RhiLY_08581 [Ceratobasidium sp. AG-Ba]